MNAPPARRRPILMRLWARLNADERHSTASMERRRGGQQIYGWWENFGRRSNVPAYAPPSDGPCLLCGQPLTSIPSEFEVVVVPPEDDDPPRTYFFRVHTRCFDADSDGEIEGLAIMLVGLMLLRNGD